MSYSFLVFLLVPPTMPPPVMKTEQEVFEVIKKAPFTVIVVFICFFSIWSVIGLAGFHTYLTTSDQTTNEDVSIWIIRWHEK